MRAALEQRYDVGVVGAGPAGAAAALRVRQLGGSVVLLEREGFPRSGSSLDWLGPAGVTFCEECGLSAGAVAAEEFAGLRLHAWDLKKSVTVEDEALRGWIVPRGRFEEKLVELAQGAGAATVFGAAVADLKLREQDVEISLSDGRAVVVGVLVIAEGADSPVARMAKLTDAGALRDLPRTMYASGAARGAGAQLDVAIGTARSGQLATVLRTGGQVRVSVTARGEPPLERQFAEFCQAAAKAGLLPQGALGPARREIQPAGAALELEAHVGKRCLLAGDAGGFVAAFSNEGLYPGMRSGWIAAETTVRTLKAVYPQDELATFDECWRVALAEYLRRPNTDLALLMPLVFGNEQMARRIARAFLMGVAF